MKKFIDFVSGYVAGAMLALVVCAPQWFMRLGSGKGVHTALGDFLYIAAAIIFGAVIALVLLIVIFLKMNNWQRTGIASFLATASVAAYLYQ